MAITSGNQNHSCSKKSCFYCYEMNRPRRDDIPFRKNGWSKNDLAFLEDNYLTMQAKEIERVINKSATAIWYKAHTLKIKKLGETNLLKSA